MDATVVSFLPFEINEKKPGIIPEDYVLAKSDGLIPTLLVVPDARCPIYRGGEQSPFIATIPGEKLAESIVNDYRASHMQYSEDSYPAIFWVVDKFTDPKVVMDKFKSEIAVAKKAQNNWFAKLVRDADDMWSRYYQHKMITDIQRHAAKMLGQVNKPWFTSPEPIELKSCPACKTMVQGDALVCFNCKTVLDADKYAKTGLKVATA